MDDDSLVGWVWAAQIFDGTHVWSDSAGRPVKKEA
jgi:hypothetical protein